MVSGSGILIDSPMMGEHGGAMTDNVVKHN